MNELLKKLLDLIAGKKGQIKPDELKTFFAAAADRKALQDMDAAAMATFTDIRKETVTDDTTAQLRTLAEASKLIRAEDADRQTAETARAAEIDGLAAQMTPPATATAADPAPADPATPVADPPADPAAPAAPAAAADPAPAAAPAEPAAAPAAEPEMVAASARPRATVALSQIRNRQPAGTGRVAPGAPAAAAADPYAYTTSLVAGADIPNIAPGASIDDVATLRQAWQGTFERFPIGAEGMGSLTRTVAVLHRNFPDTLVASGDNHATEAMLTDLCDESRLAGGNLLQSMLAGAGWCALTDQDYTLCPPLEGDDGYFDMPMFGVQHAGIKTPKALAWQDLYALIPEQILCEPDLIADVEKIFAKAPCPQWQETLLCAAPFGIISEIPMETAWPALIDQFVVRALTARRRRLNAYTLARIAAMTTPVVGLDVLGASHSVYDSLSLAIEWYKDLNKMGDGTTIEATGPRWLRTLLKADMGKRDSVGADVVSNQDVLNHFANLNARPQFVLDWQPLAKSVAGPPITFPPPTAWPTTVDILLAPAGTWAKGLKPMVKLNAIYDSTLLKKNEYIKSFFEDAFLITQRCATALKVTIPLCVNGAMGPRIDACAGP